LLEIWEPIAQGRKSEISLQQRKKYERKEQRTQEKESSNLKSP